MHRVPVDAGVARESCGDVVVGVGCHAATTSSDLLSLVQDVLAVHRLDPPRVSIIATHESRIHDAPVLALAASLNAVVRGYSSEALAAQPVPTPNERVRSHVGTASVAEAAVLCAGATLTVPKQRSPHATCAVGVVDV